MGAANFLDVDLPPRYCPEHMPIGTDDDCDTCAAVRAAYEAVIKARRAVRGARNKKDLEQTIRQVVREELDMRNTTEAARTGKAVVAAIAGFRREHAAAHPERMCTHGAYHSAEGCAAMEQRDDAPPLDISGHPRISYGNSSRRREPAETSYSRSGTNDACGPCAGVRVARRRAQLLASRLCSHGAYHSAEGCSAQERRNDERQRDIYATLAGGRESAEISYSQSGPEQMWCDDTNLCYIPQSLAAALDALKLAHDLATGRDQSSDGLREKLHIVVRRVAPHEAGATVGSVDGVLRCGKVHDDSPSFGDSGAGTPVVNEPSVGAAPDTGVTPSPVSGASFTAAEEKVIAKRLRWREVSEEVDRRWQAMHPEIDSAAALAYRADGASS